MRKNKWFRIVVIVIVIVATGSVLIYSTLSDNLEKLTNEPIHDVELSEIPDGSYVGEYSVFPVHVKVEVLMKDHEISDIVILEHDHGKGADAEAITDTILEQQSLDVDAVSGATYSSLVIIKAVEDALIH
ncbi:FMN-binding protein [Proteiniclasticum sp. SCR006]|uniref:FMN-binding protein n=1 Tax=Proteiniclasticum aestuarii TaxID=2817862 RepID=A0A939KI39_9CLOT|nr:FMN-binding protein [Proteiniclasticum aestuarii]MBO1263566.1 FMN-binding protein [Proteiniclasticum aestuarii]